MNRTAELIVMACQIMIELVAISAFTVFLLVVAGIASGVFQ